MGAPGLVESTTGLLFESSWSTRGLLRMPLERSASDMGSAWERSMDVLGALPDYAL